jgi:hypothetical protein
MKVPKHVAHTDSDIPDKKEFDSIIKTLKKVWAGSSDQYISCFAEASEKIRMAIRFSWPNHYWLTRATCRRTHI